MISLMQSVRGLVTPKDSSKPRLVIIEGKDKGKVIEIEPGATVIGRTKGDVILQDPRVSRSHVTLNYDERSGKLTYTDLKSLNGVLCNGNSAESGILVDGDRLQVGNTLFDCQLSPTTELAEVNVPPPPNKPARANAPLSEFNEVSVSHSNVRGREPIGFDSDLKPFQEDLGSASHPPQNAVESDDDEVTGSTSIRKEKRTLLAAYRAMRPMNRNLFMAFFVFGGFYLMFGGSGPPADFQREVTSMRQLEKDGKYDEAIQKAVALTQSYDSDPELYVTLGGLYAQQKRYEPAIQAYRKAKAINPDHPIATVRLIAVFLRSGLGKEAETQMAELDRLMKAGKHSRELFVEAANLFLEFRELTRSPEKALILSRALQTEFAIDSTIGYKLEAQLRFQLSENDEALKVIERGLQRDPQDEWLLENQAFAKLAAKDTAGASAVVESWIRIHPTATKALLVMSYLKYNEKNYLGALPYLQKIAQLGAQNPSDPHLPEALNLMGQIYWNQGQTAEAKSLFTQACESGFTQACGHESLQKLKAIEPMDADAAEAPTP